MNITKANKVRMLLNQHKNVLTANKILAYNMRTRIEIYFQVFEKTNKTKTLKVK